MALYGAAIRSRTAPTDVAATESPAWRRAFDGVERRVTPSVRAATSSPDFQVAAQRLGRAKGAVTAPVGGLVSWGLHLVGMPSRADVRQLERQLGDVQREMVALRREVDGGLDADEIGAQEPDEESE